MPRKRRNFIDGQYYHITQQGDAKRELFFTDVDRDRYLHYLKRAAVKQKCRIHAFALMTNHIHLVVSQLPGGNISRLMQHANGAYGQYLNSHLRVEGKVWGKRFRDSLINDESYLLNCMAYIDLNPVRAGLCKRPEDYAWSSHSRLALGDRRNSFLYTTPVYKALHSNRYMRRVAYRKIVAQVMDQSLFHRRANAVPNVIPGHRDKGL